MFSSLSSLLVVAAVLPTAVLAEKTSAVAAMGSMAVSRKLKVTGMGGSKTGYGTWFDKMGTPFGGCGVPPEKAMDDNGKPLPFIALNVNSEYKNGDNCGRWMRIVVGENCQGGGNTQWGVCEGGSFGPDDRTGDVIYGYTMDSCADPNVWCQNDPYHLDISEEYLMSMNLREGSIFNARKVHWDYINYVPDGYSMTPKFMWMEGSRWIGHQFWATVIIYNTPNGIGKVEQGMPPSMGSEWVEVKHLTNLGNNYELKRPCVEGSPICDNLGMIPLRVYGKDGELYGEYEITFTCGGSVCHPSMDAPAAQVA